MNLNSFPVLKKNVCLRVSKGRYIIKNLQTEECLAEEKENMIFLSLCDGTHTAADILEAYQQALHISKEEAKQRAEVILNRHHSGLFMLQEASPAKHVENFLKQIEYRTKKWKFHPLREESPFQLEMVLTEKCNHRCNYCFKSCTIESFDELTLEQWKKVIDEAADMGVQEITLSGGEPTLFYGFSELVSYIVKNGIYPRISTNGTKMTEKFVSQLKEAGAEYIHLSLPSVTEETFGKITEVKDNLEKVKRGICYLHEAGFYIRAKTVLVPQNIKNINEMEELIDFCGENGVNLLHLAPFIYTACSRGGAQLIPNEADLIKVQELALQKKKVWQDKMIIAEPPIGSLTWKGPRDIVKCGGVKEGMTILSNGNVTFCEAIGNMEEFIFGNVKKERLIEIWQSDKPDAITRVNKDKVAHECKVCNYLDDCGTGCFLFSHNTDQNPWYTDPRCWKYKGNQNVFRKYPVLKNTVRIKKLSEFCWISEAEYDLDTFIAPAQAVIMALCNGKLEPKEISYILQKVYGIEKEQAEEELKQTLNQLQVCLNWQAAPELMQERYKPEEFIYSRKQGPLYKEQRCDTPCEMHFSLTKACNFKCIYCFNGAAAARKDELSTEEWIDVIRQGKELGVVKCTLTGGEPMLYKGFFPLLEELKKNDIFPYICTNGSLINDEAIRKFKNLGIEMIQISMDTADEAINDKLTAVKGQLIKVKRAIHKLSEAHIKVVVKSVLTPLNIKQAPELIDNCIKLGVKKLILDRFDVSSSGRGGTDLVLSNEDMEWLRKIVTEKRESFEGVMQIKAAAHPTQWLCESDIVPCGAFRKSFIVLPNGDITACEKLIDVPEMTAGNVKKNTIKEIWMSNKTSGIVNPKKEVLDEECKNCSSLGECGTGCFAIKHYFHMKMYGIDPRCYKNQKGNPYNEGRL